MPCCTMSKSCVALKPCMACCVAVFDPHGTFERAIRGAHAAASAAALDLLQAEAPGGGRSALAQLNTLQQVRFALLGTSSAAASAAALSLLQAETPGDSPSALEQLNTLQRGCAAWLGCMAECCCQCWKLGELCSMPASHHQVDLDWTNWFHFLICALPRRCCCSRPAGWELSWRRPAPSWQRPSARRRRMCCLQRYCRVGLPAASQAACAVMPPTTAAPGDGRACVSVRSLPISS